MNIQEYENIQELVSCKISSNIFHSSFHPVENNCFHQPRDTCKQSLHNISIMVLLLLSLLVGVFFVLGRYKFIQGMFY
jgi:hypothetical protein